MTFSIDIGMGLTSLSVLNRGGLTALLTWAGSAGHASLIQRAGLFDADADENGLGPQGTESGSPLTYDGSEGADPGGQAPVNWDLVSAFSAATLADITREGYFHYELDTEIASVIPAAAAYICHGDSAADLEQSLINITTGFHQHEFNAGSGTTMQTFPHKMSGNHTGSNVTVDIIWSETGNFFELYTNGLLYSSTTWTQIADATLWESFFIVGKGATTSDYESAGNGGFMRRAFLLSESPVISKKTDTIILMGDSFLGHGGFGADINGTVTIGQLPWGPVSTVLSGTPADTKIQNGFNAGNLGSTTYMESRFFADTGFVPQFFRILAQAGNHIGAHSCNYIATASSYDSSGEDIEAQMAAAITDSHAPTKGVVWTGSIDVSILVAATRTPADIRTSVQGNIAAVITAGLDRVVVCNIYDPSYLTSSTQAQVDYTQVLNGMLADEAIKNSKVWGVDIWTAFGGLTPDTTLTGGPTDVHPSALGSKLGGEMAAAVANSVFWGNEHDLVTGGTEVFTSVQVGFEFVGAINWSGNPAMAVGFFGGTYHNGSRFVLDGIPNGATITSAVWTHTLSVVSGSADASRLLKMVTKDVPKIFDGSTEYPSALDVADTTTASESWTENGNRTGLVVSIPCTTVLQEIVDGDAWGSNGRNCCVVCLNNDTDAVANTGFSGTPTLTVTWTNP